MTLAIAAQNGDPQAQTELYNKFIPKMMQMSGGDPDLFSNFSTSFMEALKTFDETRGCFHTHLHYKILKERVKFFRRKKRQKSLPEGYEDMFSYEDSIKVKLDVSNLSSREQEICQMIRDGFNQKEIGDNLGVSKQRIGQILNVIKDKVRNQSYLLQK